MPLRYHRFMVRLGWIRFGLVTLFASVLTGCLSPAANMVKTPSLELDKQQKCAVGNSQAKPLVVEWASTDRGDLEARAQTGLVVVKYDGCEMHLLTRCNVPGSYDYVAFNPKKDRVRITNADELYASVPMGAAKFEAKLEQAGELGVDMTLVGKYRSDRDEVKLEELEGLCDGATHVLGGLTVGAFEFFANAKAAGGGKLEVGSAGVGGQSKAARETLTRDGNSKACDGASKSDDSPPEGCSSLLRLEVLPIGGVVQANAGAGMAGSTSTTAPPPPPPKTEQVVPLWVWIGGGAALLIAGTGGALFGASAAKQAEADAAFKEAMKIRDAEGIKAPGYVSNIEDKEDFESTAGNLLLGGIITAGLGGATLATMVVLGITQKETRVVGTQKAKMPNWALVPWVQPESGGAVLQGQF